MMPSVFQTLANVDVSSQVEQKGRFDYLSWPWAWSHVKSKYPHATFEKHIFRDNQNNPLPFMRDTKGHTYVAVTVTIEEVAHTEIHYVMDHKNQSVVHPDGAQVNKALQRCLVKAIAFHGLGLNIYAGEDLPVMDTEEAEKANRSNVDLITTDFKNAKSVEEIDSLWKANSAVYGNLPSKDQKTVLNAFKTEKIKLKSASAS